MKYSLFFFCECACVCLDACTYARLYVFGIDLAALTNCLCGHGIVYSQHRLFYLCYRITDVGHLKRRLCLSTVHKELSATLWHAKLPLAGVKRNIVSIWLIPDMLSLFLGELRVPYRMKSFCSCLSGPCCLLTLCPSPESCSRLPNFCPWMASPCLPAVKCEESLPWKQSQLCWQMMVKTNNRTFTINVKTDYATHCSS